MNNMRSGIVILNYNTFEDTVGCVQSIYTNDSSLSNFRIFIIDNASKDGSGQKLKKFYSNDVNVTVEILPSNMGFSGGNNIGTKLALEDSCDMIYLLNSDVVIVNDAISKMNESIINNTMIGIVAPAVYDSDGTFCQGRVFPITIGSYLLHKFHFKTRRDISCHLIENQSVKYKEMCAGCAFGITASFFREVLDGRLDDNVFLFYEEQILAYKLLSSVFFTQFVSDAKVIHTGQVATKKTSSRSQHMKIYYNNSALYALACYSTTPMIVCAILSILTTIYWIVRSIINNDYRASLGDYINENRRIKKAIKEKRC